MGGMTQRQADGQDRLPQSQSEVQRMRSSLREILHQIADFPVSRTDSCIVKSVTLRNGLNFSEAQFPHPRKETNNSNLEEGSRIYPKLDDPLGRD